MQSLQLVLKVVYVDCTVITVRINALGINAYKSAISAVKEFFAVALATKRAN
jgi:hypothetical protein